MGRFSFTRRMLALDSFKCHVMETVMMELLTSKTNLLIMPGECTKYIQAPMCLGISLLKQMSQRNKTNGWLVKPTLLLPRETCVLYPGERLLSGFLRRAMAWAKKNDNKFIQEPRVDSCCEWILKGRTHSPLQEKAALPCKARTAQSCSTSHEQFT